MDQMPISTGKDSTAINKNQHDIGQMLADARDEDLDIFVDSGYTTAFRNDYRAKTQESAKNCEDPLTPIKKMEVYSEGGGCNPVFASASAKVASNNFPHAWNFAVK